MLSCSTVLSPKGVEGKIYGETLEKRRVAMPDSGLPAEVAEQILPTA